MLNEVRTLRDKAWRDSRQRYIDAFKKSIRQMLGSNPSKRQHEVTDYLSVTLENMVDCLQQMEAFCDQHEQWVTETSKQLFLSQPSLLQNLYCGIESWQDVTSEMAKRAISLLYKILCEVKESSTNVVTCLLQSQLVKALVEGQFLPFVDTEPSQIQKRVLKKTLDQLLCLLFTLSPHVIFVYMGAPILEDLLALGISHVNCLVWQSLKNIHPMAQPQIDKVRELIVSQILSKTGSQTMTVQEILSSMDLVLSSRRQLSLDTQSILQWGQRCVFPKSSHMFALMRERIEGNTIDEE